MQYEKDTSSDYYDCECCGGVYNSDCSIRILPSKKYYQISHDGHFGGGCWNGENWTIPLHVIGIIHGTTQVQIQDLEWSWSLYSHNETVPVDNQNPEYAREFWKNATIVILSITKDENEKLTFNVNCRDVYSHEVFLEVFGEDELNLYLNEGYMDDHDIWETLCELYISDLDESNFPHLFEKEK